MTSRQEQRNADELTEAEQIRIYSVNKLVDKIKEKFPGMTNLKVFICFNYIKKSKIGLHYVMPLGIMINNKFFTVDKLGERLDIEAFLFNVKDSQYNYMSMRKDYKFWCLDIDSTKQIAFKSFNYYNSKLLCITDQKIINKLIPPAEELRIDIDVETGMFDEEILENEMDADIMSQGE